MKSYLVITGTIFGLIAIMHLIRAIDEWPAMSTDPWYFLGMAGLGLVAAMMSGWAFRLLRSNLQT